jgi:putative DeoR family transcriptional regulator (stage III sporulation protein D)
MKKDYIEQRVIEVSNYILLTGSTIRKAAKKFHTSKSTVHKDITQRLAIINPQLHKQIKPILEQHFETKYINGGLATKIKYQN